MKINLINNWIILLVVAKWTYSASDGGNGSKWATNKNTIASIKRSFSNLELVNGVIASNKIIKTALLGLNIN